MKKLTLLLIFLSFSLYGQNNKEACDLLTKINKLIKKEHFRPKPIDDSLSVYVFDSFINELDPDRSLFLKSEYEHLKKHRLTIDNAIRAKDCSFFDDFTTTYKKALERNKAVVQKLEKEDLDYFHNTDTLRFTTETIAFYLKEQDVEKILRKKIRYDILEDIAKMSPDIDSVKQNFDAFEKISRAKVFETKLCKINSILDDPEHLKTNLENSFYMIYTSYFDPHTAYFSSEEKSTFFSGLSTEKYSLGIYVSLNEKEEIIVEEVIPGSSISKSGKIDIGDQIIKVGSQNESYWVTCVAMKTIADIVFSDNYKEVTLTLRKKNGTVYEVTIQKEIMKSDENLVYSFIIEDENTRLGYLKIPSFYSDFDDDLNKGCARDVAKEIIKLKTDTIDGLLIDLEDNGGGSMDEAIKLLTMFLDSGPISVLVDNKNRQNIINDYNKGAIYNGPIVVLINGNSASASEFFAAALQDYNRSITIGSPSLGKATMQTVLPIDKKQKDFLKVTIDKFYRVTGKSHQITGVLPDIEIPYLFNDFVSREKNYKTALPNDSIKIHYNFIPYSRAIYQDAIDKSKKRIETNADFMTIAALNKSISSYITTPKEPVPSLFNEVFASTHQNDSIWESIKMVTSKENTLTILNTSYDSESMKNNPQLKEMNTFKIKNIKTNPYIPEAVRIIKDFVATEY